MKKLIYGLALFATALVYPQNYSSADQLYTLAATGADISNASGSISYSIGQVFFSSTTMSSGSMAQGVQQAFNEDAPQTLDLAEHPKEGLSITAYPNPMTDYLIVKLGQPSDDYSYELVSLNGKIIKKNKLKQSINKINPSFFASTTYILRIYKDDKRVKNFKLIKK